MPICLKRRPAELKLKKEKDIFTKAIKMKKILCHLIHLPAKF